MNWGLIGVLICGVVSFLLLCGAFWLYKLDKKEAEGFGIGVGWELQLRAI